MISHLAILALGTTVGWVMMCEGRTYVNYGTHPGDDDDDDDDDDDEDEDNDA